jgi:hypothetical protein
MTRLVLGGLRFAVVLEHVIPSCLDLETPYPSTPLGDHQRAAPEPCVARYRADNRFATDEQCGGMGSRSLRIEYDDGARRPEAHRTLVL